MFVRCVDTLNVRVVHLNDSHCLYLYCPFVIYIFCVVFLLASKIALTIYVLFKEKVIEDQDWYNNKIKSSKIEIVLII